MSFIPFLLTFLSFQRTDCKSTYINGICVDCASATLVPAAGSSTAAPLLRQLAFSFHLVEESIQVNFLSQTIDTAMSELQTDCRKGYELEFAALDYPLEAYEEDIPLISEDLQSIPVVALASVVTFNVPEILPKVDPDLILSRENLYDILYGNITYWNDPRIQANNLILAPKLPNKTISVVLRTDPSGTSWTLMSMFYHMNGDTEKDATSTWPPLFLNLPNRILTQSSNGVISEVTTHPYSLGFVAQAYVEEAGLPQAGLINREGKIVKAGVNLGVYQAVLEAAQQNQQTYGLSPGDMTGVGSYPLAQLVYLVYHTEVNADCDSRIGMAKFVHWLLTDQDALTQIFAYPGFIPLPTPLVNDVILTLKNLTCQDQHLLQETFVDFGGNSLTQTITIFAAVLIVISLSILTTLSYKRNNRITKAAGLAFAFFFLLGCIFNYISVIFWASIPVNHSICIGRYAFVTLGYALILGAMFAKCWEVSKIFYRAENGDISPFKELPWWMFCRAFFGVVFMEALFLFTWLLIDPPLSKIRIVDTVNFFAIRECTTQYASIWYGLHFLYFGVVLVWGAYLAYLTRDIWQKYNYPNESRSILLSIYNLGFCCVILVPLVTALDASTAVLFFLISVAIIFPTTFALFVVHGPKMLAFLASSISKGSQGSKGSRGKSGHQTTQRETGHEPSHTVRILNSVHENVLVDDMSERAVEMMPFKNTKLDRRASHIEDTTVAALTPSKLTSATPKAAVTELPGATPPLTWKVLSNPNPTRGESPSAFDAPEIPNPLFGENI